MRPHSIHLLALCQHQLVDNLERGFVGRVAAVHFCDAQDKPTLEPEKFAKGLLVSLAESVPGVEAAVVELNNDENIVVKK